MKHTRTCCYKKIVNFRGGNSNNISSCCWLFSCNCIPPSVFFCTLKLYTHIYDPLVVANEEVSENAGFIQVSQANHILHTMNGGGVHGFYVRGILRRDPVLLHTCTTYNTLALHHHSHWRSSDKKAGTLLVWCLSLSSLNTHLTFIIQDLDQARVAELDHSSNWNIERLACLEIQPNIISLHG